MAVHSTEEFDQPVQHADGADRGNVGGTYATRGQRPNGQQPPQYDDPPARKVRLQRPRKSWHQQGWPWLILAAFTLAILYFGFQAITGALGEQTQAITQQTEVLQQQAESMQERNSLLQGIAPALDGIAESMRSFSILFASLMERLIQALENLA